MYVNSDFALSDSAGGGIAIQVLMEAKGAGDNPNIPYALFLHAAAFSTIHSPMPIFSIRISRD